MAADLDPAVATAFVHQSVPAMARLGLVVEAIEPGFVRLMMPLEPNRNHVGTMYAGALFAIAELPGGVLPMSVLGAEFVPIVTHVDIDFLRPVRSDARLDARMAPANLRRTCGAGADGRQGHFRVGPDHRGRHRCVRGDCARVLPSCARSASCP
jgi:uncharacterized protein (TIGR00369 family)